MDRRRPGHPLRLVLAKISVFHAYDRHSAGLLRSLFSFPDADVYLAPRIKEQAKGRITFDGLPRDLRLSFTWRHKRELRTAVDTMIAWNPARIILAHGRWHEANGAAELRRAFHWLLK